MSLLANHGLMNLASVFEAEYQAVLDRATFLGIALPSASDQAKQNVLMKALKDAGIRSHLDRLRVFKNAGSLAFAAIDWIDPTVSVSTNVNSPTFDNNKGVKSNGTNSYVNTQVAPNSLSKFVAGSGGVFSYLGDTYTNTNGTCIWGCYSGPTNDIIQVIINTNTVISLNSSTQASLGSVKNALGLTLLRQTVSNPNADHIQNGVTTSAAVANSVRTSAPVFLCCRNNNGTPGQFDQNYQALWGIGDSLSGLEAALKTATDTFYAL